MKNLCKISAKSVKNFMFSAENPQIFVGKAGFLWQKTGILYIIFN